MLKKIFKNEETQSPGLGHHWQALRLFNLYRLILSLGFVLVLYWKENINFLGFFNEVLFKKISFIYLILSLFFLLLSIFFKKLYVWQANLPIYVDILAIILLMHACGGFISGVGILLFIIIAAHSLLVPGKLSFFSAALATLGIFTEHLTSILYQETTPMFIQAGLLGAALLATSFVTNWLSVRARKSLVLVQSQALQLATSEQLNAHIISQMHAGVIVLDNKNQIRLLNMAAQILLDLKNLSTIQRLNDLPFLFQSAFLSWLQQGKNPPPISLTHSEIRISFHRLGRELPSGTLIFIYDALEETRRVQDLKLASLGQLTANIAHELRNPLGAASHAAQLLAESRLISKEEGYLVHLIKQSCDRMNIVIQNILSLSNRKPAERVSILLIPWLQAFIKELHFAQILHPKVNLDYDDETIEIHIDPSQFTQILINLCENGLRYSLRETGQPTIKIQIQSRIHPATVYINIIDQGPGISNEFLKHLFEPFFTTEKNGTGLGLYIAKELSQMNGVRLDYQSHLQGGQFRLTFFQEEASNLWQQNQSF